MTPIEHKGEKPVIYMTDDESRTRLDSAFFLADKFFGEDGL